MNQTAKISFWSTTQQLPSLLKRICYIWVPQTIYYKIHISFFKQVLIILRNSKKICKFWLGVQFHLKSHNTIMHWSALTYSVSKFCIIFHCYQVYWITPQTHGRSSSSKRKRNVMLIWNQVRLSPPISLVSLNRAGFDINALYKRALPIDSLHQF